MRERKEDMSEGMMHEGCKMNEKMKFKHKTKTKKNKKQKQKQKQKNATKHKVNMTC